MYWSVNALCWVLLPLSQGYHTAGDFTFLRRMGTALFKHVRTYIVFGVAGGAIFLYLLISGKLNSESASAVLVVLSNLWGLFLVIVLLGYGLVEVPRKTWYAGHHTLNKKYLQFKASKLSETMNDAKFALSECMKKVNAARKLTRGDKELERCVNIIAEKCPADLLEYHNANRTHENPEILQKLTPIDRKKIVQIHCDFIKANDELRRSKCRWHMVVDRYIKLEDIIASKDNYEEKRINYTFKPHREGKWGKFRDNVEWLWQCWVSPVCCRILAVILALFSCFVVLGEITLFVDAPVGVFPLMFESSHGDVGTQLLCMIPLSFMVFTTYFGLFNLKLQGMYGLYPHNNTDPHNLTWSAAFMARLASPLCYNFLLFIKVKNSEFEKVLGIVDIVPVVGEDFAIFFPCILIVFVFMNLFNIYGRLMKALGVSQFQFSEKFNDDQVDLGASLLNKAKLHRQQKLLGFESPANKAISSGYLGKYSPPPENPSNPPDRKSKDAKPAQQPQQPQQPQRQPPPPPPSSFGSRDGSSGKLSNPRASGSGLTMYERFRRND
mmetsp:Transcript_9486/g.18310  ORF Transcript_9486/g.18310 Transcript_9486/m.18310 type:complete len:552 (-) Transcript_9486:1781-3436(-)